MYDTIIIGGGPGGLTAALYTARKKLKTLVVTVDIGGQTILTSHIENYPGYTKLSGPKLMQIFEEQAKSFGSEIVFGKAVKVGKKGKNFLVTLSNGEKYESRTVILAYGKVPRSLNIPGEEKFIGRGVSTCATCDAALFKGKETAVIGGGNSALEAAILLSKFSPKVYLIHRRNEFRGDEITVDRINKIKNIELVLDSVPLEIKGDKFVESLTVNNVKTEKKKELKVQGVFVEIGYVVDSSLVKDLVKLNKGNEIITNKNCETSQPGVFAAGDVTDVAFKQTIISAGEGALAALMAYNYIQKIEGKPESKTDWGEKTKLEEVG